MAGRRKLSALALWGSLFLTLWGPVACGADPKPEPALPKPAPKPAPAFSYALAHGCPLTYAFLLTEKSDQIYMGERHYSGQFVLRLGGSQVERGTAVQLVLEEFRTRSFNGAHRLAPALVKMSSVVTLSLDGSVWRNERDPEFPWERIGSSFGIGALFPALPKRAAEGEKAGWAVPADPEAWQGSVEVVAATTRNGDAPRAETHLMAHWAVAQAEHTGDSTLTSLRISGSPVDEATLERLLKQYSLTQGKADGRYVLSETGRMLRASIQETRELEMHYDFGDRKMKTETHLEATLVGACDGPTLPAPEGKPETKEERGIALAGEIIEALEESDPDRAARLFGDHIVAHHGGQAAAIVAEFAREHLPSALGDARYNVRGVSMQGEDVFLQLSGSGRSTRESESYDSFDSKWLIGFQRTGPTGGTGAPFVRSLTVERYGAPMLEVSVDRLYASP